VASVLIGVTPMNESHKVRQRYRIGCPGPADRMVRSRGRKNRLDNSLNTLQVMSIVWSGTGVPWCVRSETLLAGCGSSGAFFNLIFSGWESFSGRRWHSGDGGMAARPCYTVV
jgi:hypothetical protein